jgi:hypothetical protein
MNTILFVEKPEDKEKMVIGFQLNKENFYRVPRGKIRIARFESLFWIEKNMGYYGDTYMKQFIRKWKKITKENIQRRKDIANAKNLLKIRPFCFYIHNKIIEYL